MIGWKPTRKKVFKGGQFDTQMLKDSIFKLYWELRKISPSPSPDSTPAHHMHAWTFQIKIWPRPTKGLLKQIAPLDRYVRSHAARLLTQPQDNNPWTGKNETDKCILYIQPSRRWNSITKEKHENTLLRHLHFSFQKWEVRVGWSPLCSSAPSAGILIFFYGTPTSRWRKRREVLKETGKEHICARSHQKKKKKIIAKESHSFFYFYVRV